MHDDPTEILPVVPNPYNEPTQVIPAFVPGYLWADQEEDPIMGKETRRSMVEPRESVIAWPPIAIFLAVFAIYAVALWFGVVHANEVLYVLLIEWRW